MIKILILISGLLWGGQVKAEDLVREPKPRVTKSSWPAIVFLPGKAGIDTFVKKQSELWSNLGYLVLVVDLYQGKFPADEFQANRMWDQLSAEQALKLLQVSYNKLLKHPRLDRTRVGIISWGASGGLVLRHLNATSDFRVGVLIDPLPLLDRKIISTIKARLYGISGVKATMPPPGANRDLLKALEKFETLLQEERVQFEFKKFANAPAGFLDFTSSRVYSAKDAAEANRDLELFLARFLSLDNPVKF